MATRITAGKLSLQVDHWPLVIVVLADGASKQDYITLLDALAKHVEAARTPYVTITDAREVHSVPPADVRRYIAEWMEAHAEGTRAIGAVTISDSALVRGALTALYWIFTPPVPQGVVKSWTEAHAWALTRLREMDVAFSPEVASLHRAPH